jgi:MFS superfamily sulfate permease-like transporter
MFKAIISGHIDEHFIKYYKCANWALLVLMAVVANMVSSLDMVTGILVGGFVANLNCIGLERDCKRMVRWHTIIVSDWGLLPWR